MSENPRTGARTLYTLRDGHGESQQVMVCAEHARAMPPVDGDRVTAQPADDDCSCELCTVSHPATRCAKLQSTRHDCRGRASRRPTVEVLVSVNPTTARHPEGVQITLNAFTGGRVEQVLLTPAAAWWLAKSLLVAAGRSA